MCEGRAIIHRTLKAESTILRARLNRMRSHVPLRERGRLMRNRAPRGPVVRDVLIQQAGVWASRRSRMAVPLISPDDRRGGFKYRVSHELCLHARERCREMWSTLHLAS